MELTLASGLPAAVFLVTLWRLATGLYRMAKADKEAEPPSYTPFAFDVLLMVWSGAVLVVAYVP